MEPNNYPALDKQFTLTEAEEEAYQQLLSRQEKGEELKPGEWEAFDALAARRRRRAELDEFRLAGKIGSLGDWVGVPAERNEQTNLPAKIRLYEQGKQHRTSPASLKAFANDELARQPDLKVKAIREANLYYGSDADKYQIQLDFVEQVYAGFYEYVERDLAKLAGGTVAIPEATATLPTPTSTSKRQQAGTPTENRVADNIDALFSWNFKTTHCDRLAKMVELHPPDEEFEKVGKANTKIWAVVKAIKTGRASSSYSSKTEAALAKALGKRYGYTVSSKLSKVNENTELLTSLEHLKHMIAVWREQGDIR